MVFLEDLIANYPEEINALGICTDSPYNVHEVQLLALHCESYRERQLLLAKILRLEERVTVLEKG